MAEPLRRCWRAQMQAMAFAPLAVDSLRIKQRRAVCCPVIEYTQPAAIADSGVLVALHPGAAARLPFVEEDLPFVEEDRWKQKVLEPTRVAKGSENKFTMKITIGDFDFR